MSQDSFSNFMTLDLFYSFLQSAKKYGSKLPEIFLVWSSPLILLKLPLSFASVVSVLLIWDSTLSTFSLVQGFVIES